MEIRVLRKMEYEKHMIYVMHFSNVFQYLFADKDKNIYQDNIRLTRSLLNIIKYKLRLLPVPFSREEMELGEKLVLSGAMASIDAVIAKEKEQRKEFKVLSDTANKGKTDKRCSWRASYAEDGKLEYECINHNIFVEMKNGEKPFHDFPKGEPVLSPLQFKE